MKLDWWKTAWLVLGVIAVGFYGWSLSRDRYTYLSDTADGMIRIVRIERGSDNVEMLVPYKGWLRIDNEEKAALQRAIWNK